MATVHDLVNVGTCTSSAFNGTNNDFCKLDIKRIKKILRAPVNFKFASDFEFTLANMNLLEQQGKIVPLYKTVDSVFTTEENTVQTFGGGEKELIEKLPIQIDAVMKNGIQGYQNTLSIEKAQIHSFFLVDKDNTIFGAKGSDGLFGGVNSDFMQVMDYKGAGDNSAQYMIQFQLNRSQFDNNLAGLREDQYDFDIDELIGVTNLEITIPTAPVVGATTVTFKVVRNEDKVAQLGLDNTELEVSIDGTPEVTPTITDNGDGTYTTSVTALTLGQIVTIRTYDGTFTIVDLDGKLLKSLKTASTVTV